VTLSLGLVTGFVVVLAIVCTLLHHMNTRP
jgi:hypothetical protein